mmetsp:Transcript_8797/g.17877  ORF Transcript_8797/g.17877 Transcript_8797/m.17877 type:complete len:204 (-) Transcript_8797:16-627(-)
MAKVSPVVESESQEVHDQLRAEKKSPSTLSINERTLASADMHKEAKANRLYGAATVFFGICCVSPDAMILRLIENKSDAPSDMIVLWKSLFKGLLLVLLIASSTGLRKSFEGGAAGSPLYLVWGPVWRRRGDGLYVHAACDHHRPRHALLLAQPAVVCLAGVVRPEGAPRVAYCSRARVRHVSSALRLCATGQPRGQAIISLG